MKQKHEADDFVPLVKEETVTWRMFDGLTEIGRSYGMKTNVAKLRLRCARHVARMGERRGVYRVLVGKPEGKRPLGRPRRR